MGFYYSYFSSFFLRLFYRNTDHSLNITQDISHITCVTTNKNIIQYTWHITLCHSSYTFNKTHPDFIKIDWSFFYWSIWEVLDLLMCADSSTNTKSKCPVSHVNCHVWGVTCQVSYVPSHLAQTALQICSTYYIYYTSPGTPACRGKPGEGTNLV